MMHGYTVDNARNSADVQLARACAAGDGHARRRVFALYYPHIRKFLGNKAPRGHVEDLINDIFVRLFERCLENYAGSGRLLGFILGVAYRRLLEFYREFPGRDRVAVDDLDEPTDRRPSPSRVAAQHQRRELLCAALRALPPDAQTLLELYYWDQLTTGEVAEVLGRPVGTVRTQLMRARELLERRLRIVGFDASDWVELSTTGGAP